MIRFFRNIRQKLITEGHLSKYLIYAIGEILLVVIGILIALQINNWNEDRNQKKLITKFYESLINDLQNDIKSLEYTEEANLFRFHSCQYLLEMAELPKYNAENDGVSIALWEQKNNFIWQDNIPLEYDSSFVHLAFLWSHRMAYPKISNSTYQELTNTGLFSQIPVNLKDAIRSYYENASFSFGTREAFQPIIEDWLDALSEHGIHNGDAFIYGDPVTLIKRDKLLSGRLRRNIRQMGWMTAGAPLVTKEAEQLISLLNQEININD